MTTLFLPSSETHSELWAASMATVFNLLPSLLPVLLPLTHFQMF